MEIIRDIKPYEFSIRELLYDYTFVNDEGLLVVNRCEFKTIDDSFRFLNLMDVLGWDWKNTEESTIYFFLDENERPRIGFYDPISKRKIPLFVVASTSLQGSEVDKNHTYLLRTEEDVKRYYTSFIKQKLLTKRNPL